MGAASAGREHVDLDGEWRFVPDPERMLTADHLPAGQPIRVPGCWEAQVANPQRILSAWYLRSIQVPGDWRGQRVVLVFGAVMYQASVFLNGRSVGDHEGGYTPFEFDVTDAVRWSDENDLVVRVFNPMNGLRAFPARETDLAEADALSPGMPASEIPHGKQSWYASQSGIWQSVRLERRSSPSFGRLRVEPDVATASARVRWDIEGLPHPSEAAGDGAELTIDLSLADPAGGVISRERMHPHGDPAGHARLDVPDPMLWEVGVPNLYRLQARLMAGDQIIDSIETRFGMREIRAEAGRILLNGRPIYLVGALDQDLYAETISTPPSREMLDEQLARARELGFNLLRCHIKVPDPAYLDAADEAGMLLWCELPNWHTFSAAAAHRGRETLRAMVEGLGNHPSIVIWTIINEDWGTNLREEARDRVWLAETYAWLKALDPTRLVVDNSACDTASSPNFHVRTDLADFHVYYAAPDNAARWRHRIEEFAARPGWMWSPHGDAQPTGDEPLVLSEFGSWGLPRLDRLIADGRRPPWWFDTGHAQLLPAGVAGRFGAHGLDRIWGSVEELEEATQWHQFEALQFEIGQLRRHDTIQGYVITELADAYWEANGLLDVHRGRKAYHEHLGRFNGQDVVVVDLDRRDVWGGEMLVGNVHLGCYGSPSAVEAESGRIEWSLEGPDRPYATGSLTVGDWPRAGARLVGRLALQVPVTAAGDARLVVRAIDQTGRERAADEYRLVILPTSAATTGQPLAIAIHDPFGSWGVDERLSALGHRKARPERCDVQLATEITPDFLAAIDSGASGLVLARDRGALGRGMGISRKVAIRARGIADGSDFGGRSPWGGDWVTAWSWLLPGALPGLPERNPLDFAYAEVIPDHVMAGYDPGLHRGEVIAGMFSGWIHAPAALVWRFPQGRGHLTLTTFRLAPERGPVATVMLEGLLRYAGGDRARPPGATGRSATAHPRGAGSVRPSG